MQPALARVLRQVLVAGVLVEELHDRRRSGLSEDEQVGERVRPRAAERGLDGATTLVDLTKAGDLSTIDDAQGGLRIGGAARLDDIARHPLVRERYPALALACEAVATPAIRAMGTVGGNLCQRPRCWYFRNGYGLLALHDGASLIEAGDNRYHAIFGNSGPAKFVSSSRFAPAAITWGAKVRVIGPGQQEQMVPLEYFFVTPKSSTQGLTVLKPGQLITHVWLPNAKASRPHSTL